MSTAQCQCLNTMSWPDAIRTRSSFLEPRQSTISKNSRFHSRTGDRDDDTPDQHPKNAAFFDRPQHMYTKVNQNASCLRLVLPLASLVLRLASPRNATGDEHLLIPPKSCAQHGWHCTKQPMSTSKARYKKRTRKKEIKLSQSWFASLQFRTGCMSLMCRLDVTSAQPQKRIQKTLKPRTLSVSGPSAGQPGACRSKEGRGGSRRRSPGRFGFCRLFRYHHRRVIIYSKGH